MMIRFKLWLSLSLVYCLFPLAAFASDCISDPNECTLKKLCEVATTLDGGNTVWSTELGLVKHVTTAQTLGMECGVNSVVDLCATDPSECKVSEICEKATTKSAGQISWDDSAAAYVALAKEYGLICGVSAVKACSSSSPTGCTAVELCKMATYKYGSGNEWLLDSFIIVKEAKKRGLTCGVSEVSAVKACSSSSSPTGCTAVELCKMATYNKRWFSNSNFYVKEAKKRGLTCGVIETKELPLCQTTGVWNNCFGIWTSDEGNKSIGSWLSNRLVGVATYLFLKNDKWKDDVRIGGFQNNNWVGQGLYIWHTGEARFEWLWNPSKSYNSNSTVSAVFPSLTRMFNNLPKSQRTAIQRSLAKKGLYSSTIDGAWGRNTLIGIGRFTAEHLNSINLKSFENVEIVIDAMLDQSALTRTKVAKPSIYDAVAKRDAVATQVVSKESSYKGSYTGQSLLYRKQIQFALKKLGFYSSSIDGLWGSGTSSAIVNYVQANELDGNTPNSVFRSIISRVSVPTSFDAPKPKSVPRSTNTNGLKAITSNPSIAADQAYAVCLPLARQARSQASNQSKQALRPSPYNTTCKQDYRGDFDCSSQRASGGFWGGVADGLSSSSAGRGAYNAVLDSCLAQYGWRKP